MVVCVGDTRNDLRILMGSLLEDWWDGMIILIWNLNIHLQGW